MTRIARALALAFAAVIAVAAAPNWGATVAETPGGGHLIGNPAAKTKLIEFVSYTCPHCAHFEQEASGAIRLAWIQPGKVSVEVRHLVRDPFDLTAAILTNCGAKDKFAQNHALFMLKQDEWIGKIQLALPSQRQRWGSGTMPSRWKAIASDLGFYDMMVGRGYTRSQIDQCLSNEAAGRAIADKSNAGSEAFGVNSTPSFVLNGKLLDGVHTWEQLQPAVNAAAK
jgi:protein-disulfide isomerase